PVNMSDQIVDVQLQGSTISQQHQEVNCKLTSGMYLRLSRNNSTDTLQANAGQDSLPRIASYLPHPGMTVEKAISIFDQVRDSIPTYTQGDCHVFSACIIKE